VAKKWQGRGASAPATVLVEQKAPLFKRIAAIAIALVLGGVLVVWGVDLGQRIFGASQGAPTAQQQLELVQAELLQVSAERDALLAIVKQAGLPLPGEEAKTVAPEPKPVQEIKP
jgi:hypothetical protein